MFRPLLTGRGIAPARTLECECAARLSAVEARLGLVEALAKKTAERPAAAIAKAKPKVPTKAPASKPPKPDPDPPRDARGWPEGYEVEVRQF